MKERFIMISFLTLLSLFTVGSIGKKDISFSENENRYLQQRPEFTIPSFLEGAYGLDYELYLTDQFIFRDSWIKYKVNTDKLLLKKDINGVYLGKDGYFIEKINNMDIDKDISNRNLERLGEFYNRYKDSMSQITFMLIPTAGEILKDKLPPFATNYNQQEIINKAKEIIPYPFVDVTESLLKGKEDYIYYKTDHHWTTKGAYYAYLEFANFNGITPYKESDFIIKEVTKDFYGTLQSKLNIPVMGDSIFLYYLKENIKYQVTYDFTKTADSLYELNYLTHKDKYSVFLDGNHGIVEIKSSVDNNKNLLVIKDSYAHSLLPFLANHYENIYMVDFRYFNMSLNEFIKEKQITDIFVLYNVINFATDKYSIKFLN